MRLHSVGLVSVVVLLLSGACGREGHESAAGASALPVAAPGAAEPAAAAAPPAAPAQAAGAPVPGGLLGSCTIQGLSCSDYRGAGPSGEIQTQCEKYGGKWSAEACPQAQVQGVCTRVERSIEVITYSYPPGTAETARTACSNTPGGVFRLP